MVMLVLSLAVRKADQMDDGGDNDGVKWQQKHTQATRMLCSLAGGGSFWWWTERQNGFSR